MQHFTELPRVAELDVVIEAEQAARVVANVGLPEDTMWMVDLRGAASVAFGAAHAKRRKEYIVGYEHSDIASP